MTLILPLQISLHSGNYSPFFVVATLVDCAKILGLPQLKLRDSKGRLYVPDKALLQEPLAIVYANADIPASEHGVSKRMTFIMSYVRR